MRTSQEFGPTAAREDQIHEGFRVVKGLGETSVLDGYPDLDSYDGVIILGSE